MILGIFVGRVTKVSELLKNSRVCDTHNFTDTGQALMPRTAHVYTDHRFNNHRTMIEHQMGLGLSINVFLPPLGPPRGSPAPRKLWWVPPLDGRGDVLFSKPFRSPSVRTIRPSA